MGRSWWSLGWNSRNTVLMGWTKGVVIFGKIHPGKRSDMTGHDKKMCSTEEQCWNLLERTAQHYLCSFGFDRDGCLQICHLAKTNTAGKSSCPWDFFWFFTVKVSRKKNGWCFFGGQLRCSMKDIPERPACDKGIWYPQWDIRYSGYSLGPRGKSLSSGQSTNSMARWGKWQLGSWMNYQKVPGATLLTS